MTLSTFKPEEINVDEVIDHLNRCLNLNIKSSAEIKQLDFITPEDREQLEFIFRIAEARGKSISELKIDLYEARDKYEKALLLWRELEKAPEKLELHIKAFNLMAEFNCIFWDFYSTDARKILKEFAVTIDQINKSVNLESWQEQDIRYIILKEYKKAMQRFTNSVFGAIEWKNCETELGRKLFYLRQEIILSGKPLLNATEVEQYLQEI